MKKYFIIGVLFLLVLFSVNAQGLYFDIGIGFGGAITKLDGINVSSLVGNVKESVVDLGFKAGYGPIANIPLYIVGTLGGIGHRLDDGLDWLQFNSYIIGPGVIFYPIPLIQIAGSIGLSWVGNETSLPVIMYDSLGGFAGDISIAVDLGRGNHGCLIGLRYFGSSNDLEISRVKQNTTAFTIFVRYTFRQK